MNTLSITPFFITKYMDGDLVSIVKELHIVLVAFAEVYLAMLLDLIFGMRAAKRRGEIKTSIGLRRSTMKFLEYNGCMLIAFLVDIIASISESVNVPYVTFTMALILLGIEAYSIYENLQNKKIKSIDGKEWKRLLTIIENRDDLINALAKAAKEKLEENTKEKETNKDDNK